MPPSAAARAANKCRMDIYLVGGAVRDELLGLPVKERDWVVVGATAADMQAQGFRQVGRDFPVFLHPETHEEYALARTERKSAPGYTGFIVHADQDVTLEQDLLRRDLTINAMARTATGLLIDPYGGQHDLQQGRLRHVSPAFAEDPVRILRIARFAARFAAFGFHIAHETQALLRRMVSAGEVDALVPERVWAELARALTEAAPTRFFIVLKGCGALQRLLPELDNQIDTAPAHAVTASSAALRALQQAALISADPCVRYAAVMHAIGNGRPPAERSSILQRLHERLKPPQSYRTLSALVNSHHEQVREALTLDAESLLTLLETVDALRRPQRLQQVLLACAAIHGAAVKNPAVFPAADLLQRAQAVAVSVSGAALAADGWVGTGLARELRARRVQAIAALMH